MAGMREDSRPKPPTSGSGPRSSETPGGAGGVEAIVRGEEGRQPPAVAGVDDQVEDVAHPGGGLLGAHLVEDQDVGADHRVEHLPLRLRRAGVEGRLDLVDQRGEVDEAAVDPVAPDQLGEDGGGKVGLAGPRRADEEQARLPQAPLGDEAVDVAAGGRQRLDELDLRALELIQVEPLEAAALVARRDAGGLEQPAGQPLIPALAGPRLAGPAVGLHDPPPSATPRADRLRHFAGRHARMVARGSEHRSIRAGGPMATRTRAWPRWASRSFCWRAISATRRSTAERICSICC